MMLNKSVFALLASFGLALTPVLATAQEISITRSVLTNLPFTVIYPGTMVASGGGDGPLTINHTSAPLQCELNVVAVEDAVWTPQDALSTLNDAEVTAAWAETLPGFTLTAKGTVDYQEVTALTYEGTSTDSPMGIPVTLVHTETVANGRGYALDCIYATEVAADARPLVDFIITNFSTRADADCCVGTEAQPSATLPTAQ